jgi:GntR family transcriptional repressor for pyruvate dehydrogenase complex
MDILKKFEEISVSNPSELIIRQIKDFISSGVLKPGDRLPSERQLTEKLGVSRAHVRNAMKKLEFYGIVKVVPQSGTIVSSLGIPAIEGMIGNILQLDSYSFHSLVETRVMMEAQAAKLAAERRTDEDIAALEAAHSVYMAQVSLGGPATDQDIMLHLKIVEASKNPMLRSMMLFITPEILTNYRRHKVCTNVTDAALMEHKLLVEYIKDKNTIGAVNIMHQHLHNVLEFSKTFNTKDLTFNQ